MKRQTALRKHFFSVLFYIFPLLTMAQAPEPCLTEAIHANRPHPSGIEQTRAAYQTYLNTPRTSTATYTIPVVVHLLQSTSTALVPDSLVHSQIVALNETFRKLNADTVNIPPVFQSIAADCDIEFQLASIDPYGCPATGINRIQSPLAIHEGGQERYMKGLIQWDPHRYLNIWVTESINGGFAQGYGTFPDWFADNPELDGVVISENVFGYIPNDPLHTGKVGTHEVGHWLGLYHTFQDGCVGLTSSNCATEGDMVCDTPPSAAANMGCNSTLNTCTESPIDLPDIDASYMSYGSDLCRTMFTVGQATRMHFFLNGIRSQIHTPANLALTGVDGSVSFGCTPIASFSSDVRSICSGQSVQFADESPGVPASWSWTFQGGSPATSTQQNPTVVFPTNGIFDIGLTVTNSFGNTTTTELSYINVSAATAPALLESFEDSLPFPPGWDVLNGDEQSTWVPFGESASQGQVSMKVDNYDLVGDGSGDDLVSPLVDLSGLGQAELTFDRAYRRRSNFHRDTLQVQVSTDCGLSWTTEWEGDLLKLASVGGYAGGSPFVPLPSQWKADTIDLAAYLGESQVRFRFRCIGQGGQNLYIDHINLGGVISSLDPALPQVRFSVESPFRESLQVTLWQNSSLPLEMELLDLHGKVHWQEQWPTGLAQGEQVEIQNLQHLSPGIYFVRAKTEKWSLVRKVVRVH